MPGCGNLLVPLMAAMGLGKPVPLGLCRSCWLWLFREHLESDFECSDDLEDVLAVFFSTLPRANEFLPARPMVELRDSFPDC